MTARRTGGKPKTLISDIDVDSGSSGPNSPSVDSDDTSGRKRTNKTENELRKIRGKHDESSLWLSDFDPTKGRKARTKLKETVYKDSHVGIVGAKNNRTVRKDSLYDAKGVLLQVNFEYGKHCWSIPSISRPSQKYSWSYWRIPKYLFHYLWW